MVHGTPRHASSRRFGPYPAAIVAAALLLALQDWDAGVDAQDSLAALTQLREAVGRRLPAASERALEETESKSPLAKFAGQDRERSAALRRTVGCPTYEGNPFSPMVAFEDNPQARALEGFSMRDRRGRHMRSWRALKRSERAGRGVVVQRPLLVFLETPTERQDFTQPWFGPVRFDRPGFPTTKQKIADQVFGKNFDHHDPSSVAGFYYRESGGQLVIKGDKSSIHTVTLPHMTFDPKPMTEAILEQIDPIVDFSRRADEFGWADPIFIMTPYSLTLDVFDANVMLGPRFGLYLGLGPSVEDIGPAITDDALPDGTHVGLASLAISMVALDMGANEDPDNAAYGLGADDVRNDDVSLYAHEYGHAIGLSHMMSMDYREEIDEFGPDSVFDRHFTYPFNRSLGSGFVTTVMNYAQGSGFTDLLPRDGKQSSGLDPVNRSKLGWGNVTEVTLAGNGSPRQGELAPGGRRRVEIVEHLGRGPHDSRPQIVKVNLPGKEVSLFPHTDAAGNRTTYWRPGGGGQRMVWSGRAFGGSRLLETELRIPAGTTEPVLSFWTKYGGPATSPNVPGYDLGWVQISTDRGRTWTSLPGQTSSTFVQPSRLERQWFGDDLGAPAFTGNSHAFSPDGWVFEHVPLPVSAGTSLRVRFNFSGHSPRANQNTAQDFGWLIDDVYLGTPGDPTRHLISDFESDDDRRWTGLLREFDQGIGFVVVEETATFPQAYFFELRGNNAHDAIAFTDTHPKVINARTDLSRYRYQDGVVGYYTDHYASFSTYPYFHAGSATLARVPTDRLRRAWISYPFTPQAYRETLYDFGGLLALAFDPTSGVTLDDVVFVFTLPEEMFVPILFQGLALVSVGTFPTPSPVTILDASPTYRPFDVEPAAPETPFPGRPSRLWPFVLGSPGGWPKSNWHGPLGLNDPTTTTIVGQPFLARDAAFHPERNAVFDDRVNYRAAFVNEFANWHAQPSLAAFGSTRRSERIRIVPTRVVPVGPSESIQLYGVRYCPQNAAGTCVALDQAAQRPFVEQLMYERLSPMVLGIVLGQCPAEPVEVTAATKAAWDAFNPCFGSAIQVAHEFTTELVGIARGLGNNPFYAGLNAFGDQGTLSPGLWAESYIDLWSRSKAPAPLPSVGVSVEVERITSGDTPAATLTIRRAGQPRQLTSR